MAQGSSLGSLLFLLFINIFSNQTSCLSKLFADDTCRVISNERSSLLKTKINEQLSNVLIWYNANKVNRNQSSYLAVPPKLNVPIPKLCITPNSLVLSTGESVKYLEFNIDSHLNFSTYV